MPTTSSLDFILSVPAAERSTHCSGCARPVRVRADGNVEVFVESNRKRGAGHVPAHVELAEWIDDDGLVMWDCPACEYADSLDLTEWRA